MTLPDFLCIGAQKAGTTWLYDMLKQHPSIWMPPVKEIHYFDRLDDTDEKRNERQEAFRKKLRRRTAEDGWSGDDASRKAYIKAATAHPVNTIEWYKALFNAPVAKGKVLGEITPAYLELDEATIKLIVDTMPNIKIILLIREPVARAISQLKMSLTRGKLATATPEDQHARATALANGRNLRGNYRRQIPVWQKHIPADRFLILPFGMVRDKPTELLARIETFLNVPKFEGYKAVTEASHQTKSVELADTVKATLEARLVKDRDYLKSTFGEAFYEQTR